MCCRRRGWRGGTSRHLPQTTPPCGMTTMWQLMLPRQQPWLSQPPAKQATPCGSRKGGNASQLPLRILSCACAKLPIPPAWCNPSSHAPTSTRRRCSMAGTMKQSPSTVIESSAWTVEIPHGFVPRGWWLTLMSPGLVLLLTLCYLKWVALLRLNAPSLAGTDHLRMLPGRKGNFARRSLRVHGACTSPTTVMHSFKCSCLSPRPSSAILLCGHQPKPMSSG